MKLVRSLRILMVAGVLATSLAFGFAQGGHGSATITVTRNTITVTRA